MARPPDRPKPPETARSGFNAGAVKEAFFRHETQNAYKCPYRDLPAPHGWTNTLADVSQFFKRDEYLFKWTRQI
jgi:hypothetical protein